jgi:16S rRNA A1518/A1519 N6-dimethyltransferase RsmA/KsgA/DIM1 with predicted DNA glycosylase/AP lyase activity
VTSTFLRLEPLAGAPDADELAEVERIARAGFAHRRKTLVNSLRAEGCGELESLLAEAGIAAGVRAEVVPPEAWRRLARAAREARRGAG